jgi:hypothetical protein
VENQVDSPKTVWKPEDVSSGSGLANNLKGTKGFIFSALDLWKFERRERRRVASNENCRV